MHNNLAITVDMGTTNCKVSLFESDNGKLLDRKIFPTYKLTDNFGELFDYKRIFNELLKVFYQFAAERDRIDSISFATVGESGVLMNENGDIITPMIAWYDTRSKEYIDMLTDEEKRMIYEITGLPAHTNYSLSKIKWLFEHYKLDLNQKYYWLSVPDLFVYLLTSQIKTEYSIASRTMCLDLSKKKWSQEILEIFKLQDQLILPKILPAGTTIGYVNKEKYGGFKNNDISVKIAGHDHKVGAYGLGLKNNHILNSTGTTEGILLVTDELQINEKQYEYSTSNGIHTDPKQYTLFSSMPSGGNVFRWYNDLFRIDYDFLNYKIERLFQEYCSDEFTLMGHEVIIPHFNGSGAPFKNGFSKGLSYNLTLNTTRDEILMGLILGLALEMKHVGKCFDIKNKGPISIIGPAVKNRLWLQMKADSLNKVIYAILMDEVVSFGALSLAYKDKKYEIPIEKITPIQKRVEEFNKIYIEYQEYYDSKMRITKENLC